MRTASQKRRPFNGDFSLGNGLISSGARSAEQGDAIVLSHCSLLRNPRTKPTGVLEHCREGETNCWFSIFRGVSF